MHVGSARKRSHVRSADKLALEECKWRCWRAVSAVNCGKAVAGRFVFFKQMTLRLVNDASRVPTWAGTMWSDRLKAVSVVDGSALRIAVVVDAAMRQPISEA